MAVLFAQPIEEYPPHLAFSTVPTMTGMDANFPASKLLTYDPTAVAKTTGTGTTITWDFGLVREFDVVALLHTNTSYAATWRVQTSVDGVAWVNLFANTVLWAHLSSVPGAWTGEINDPRRGSIRRNHSWYYNPAGHSTQYLRIILTDPNTTGITIGRLFVGKSFSPSTGMQYGSSFTFSDTARRERTDQGALIIDSAANTIVTASVKTDFLTTTEMYDYVWEFEYWRGSSREILACLDTTDVPRLQKNILYCTMTEGHTINSDAFNAYSKTWVLEALA